MPTSKSFLLDVNCWLAAAAQRHAHHPIAKAWLDSARDTLLFCRVTQMGFLRLITNPKVMGADVLTPRQAWATYSELRRDSRVAFTLESAELEEQWQVNTDERTFSQNLWTDAYLAAFANAGGHTVVTLDNDFRLFAGIEVVVLEMTPRAKQS